MTKITKPNGSELLLNYKSEIERFNNGGIENMNFLDKNSPYDIFKNSESSYISSRINSDFIFSKIIKIKIDDEIVYENNNNDQVKFGYKEVLDTYNAEYIKDINEIDNLINNLETYKDEFKKTFNPNFLNNDKNSESIVELHRLNYINVLNDYKKIIDSEKESTPAQIRNRIDYITCLKNESNINFKQNGFPSLINNFKSFVFNSNDTNQLCRFKEIIDNLNNSFDITR